MQKYRLSKVSILRWALLNSILFLGGWIILFNIFKQKVNFENLEIIIQFITFLYVVFVLIYPIIRYFSWSYKLDTKSIEIRYGIVYRKTICIPIDRIKYIDLSQDPIEMILRIKTVKIYTAGGKVSIPGVAYKVASIIWNLVRTYG